MLLELAQGFGLVIPDPFSSCKLGLGTRLALHPREDQYELYLEYNTHIST